MGTLLAGAATDAGPAREHNEDVVQLAAAGSPQAAEQGYLAVVADGMGGHQHGEVASTLAVETLFASFYAPAAPGQTGDAGAAARLKRGFRAANERIAAQAARQAQEAGGDARHTMGTTMVAAAIVGDQLTIANVGDSRAYLVRADAATQITHDHSLVAEQVQAGVMTPEEARESNHRNIITRTLGHRPQVDVDIFEISLLPDDRVILCSDGVHGHVEPEEVAGIATRGDPERASRTLIDLAMERGSTDNVSAAVICYEPVAAARADVAAGEPVAAGRGRVVLLALFLLLIVVAFGILGYLYLTGALG